MIKKTRFNSDPLGAPGNPRWSPKIKIKTRNKDARAFSCASASAMISCSLLERKRAFSVCSSASEPCASSSLRPRAAYSGMARTVKRGPLALRTYK